MLIAARNGMMVGKRLPYDAEVEYLQTNPDGAYIDTQIPFPASGIVRCKFYVDGARAYGPSIRCWLLGMSEYSPIIYQQWYSGGRINFRYNAGYSSNLITINWSNAIIESSNSYNNGVGTIMFFGNCTGSVGETPRSAGAKAKDRIYRLEIEDGNGVKAVDLIPVRFTNEQGVTEGAMYDRVTKQLFRNAGTGAFIIGPDAVSTAGGGYKRKCVRRSHRRSARPSARFCWSHLWKEVA